MELSTLEYFVAAATHDTLSEAARLVHVSQPAMSAAIRRLEEEVGMRLLERSRGRGRVRVTKAGKRVLAGARRVLREVDRLVAELKSWSELDVGTLHIGAGTAALEYFLPQPIATLTRRYPNLRINLHEYRRGLTIERLLDGEIDIGVVTGPAHHADLVSAAWFEEPLLLVGPPQLSKQEPRRVSLVIDDHPLISYGSGELQDQLDSALAAVGVNRREDRLVIRSGEAMKRYIAAGLGLGFLSARSVQAALESGALIEVPLADFQFVRQYELLFRAEKNPAVEAFLQVLGIALR